MLFSLLYYQRIIDLRSDILKKYKKKNQAPTEKRQLNESKRKELHEKCETLQVGFLKDGRRKDDLDVL